MEGQFTLDSSENKKLQLALQQYVTQNTPQIKPVEAETDDPITNREILPQTHTLECRTCGVEFETHADMVTHFKSSSHLEAKELGIQAKSTSGSTGDSNVVSRDAACAPQRPTIDVHGVRSKNSPKTSLRIPLPQTESNATADVFIRTWKILVDGSLSASQSSAAKSMTENFLELLHDRGSWAVLSLQNGFFAGAIFDRRGKPVLHKTFQRYTTRRKQGGSQAKHDGAKGHARSAGANLRRQQAEELRREVTSLVTEWSEALSTCRFIFLSVTRENRSLFFQSSQKNKGSDAKRKQRLLDKSDRRILNVPFQTHRPSLKEIKRMYQNLLSFEVTTNDVVIGTERSLPDTVRAPTDAQPEEEIDTAPESVDAVDDIPFCAICLEPFTNLQTFTLHCEHKFHAHCCSLWLDEEGTCPICREDVGTAATIGIKIPLSALHIAASRHGVEEDSTAEPSSVDALPLPDLLPRLPRHTLNLRCGDMFETALHCAARNTSEHSAEAVRLLLDYGADPTVKSLPGRPAYTYATKLARIAFQEFRRQNPELWDYDDAGVPEPESEAAIAERKAKLREKRRKKRQRKKKKAAAKTNAQASSRTTAEAGTSNSGRATNAGADEPAIQDAELSRKLETVATELKMSSIQLVEIVTRSSEDLATSIQSIYELLSAGVPGDAVLESLTAVHSATPAENEEHAEPSAPASASTDCAVCGSAIPPREEKHAYQDKEFCSQGCFRQFRRKLHGDAAAARMKKGKNRAS